MDKIEIFTDYIKLDQSLKLAGVVGQGSDAKMLICDSQVTLNGEVCTMRGKKCRPGDVINVADQFSFVIVSDHKENSP